MKRAGVSPENAESLAIAISSLVFAILALLVVPELDERGTAAQVIAAVVGAVGLSGLFLTLRRFFTRLWAKPLLGVWLYRTQPHGQSTRQDLGFGLAEFSLGPDGSLEYRVDLYRDAEALLQASRGEVPAIESHGTATGLATRFESGKGALWILYQVEYYDDHEPDREGHLFLRAAGPSGQVALRGSWASDLDGKELSAGVMTMARPDEFQSFVERESSVE